MRVQLEQGILEGTNDWSGFMDIESQKTYEQFFIVNENV